MSGEAAAPIKRKNVRYKADPAHGAQIGFNLPGTPFKSEIAALIFDESYRGCCLVAIKHEKLVIGTRCRIRLGPLDAICAEVKWLSEIDDDLTRVGFQFCE